MITAWYQDPGDMHRILQDILIELTVAHHARHRVQRRAAAP